MNKVATRAFVSFVAMGLCTSLHAKNYAERDALRARSITTGMPSSSVTILGIDSSRTRSPESIVGRFRSAGLVTSPTRSSHQDQLRTLIRGDDWRIEVANDGTAAKYRRLDTIKNCRPYDNNPPDNALLQSAARARIENGLGDIIGLSPADTVVPYSTRHEFKISHTVATNVETTEICSSIVSFSRRFDGVDIVGHGSRIQIILDPDLTVVGLFFDWPRLVATSQNQQLLDISGITSRVRQLGLLTTEPTAVQEAMECGLHDPGYRFRGASTKIQAGCSIYTRYYHPLAGSAQSTAASLDTVPIGVDVIKDPSWDVVARYCSSGQKCVD